MKKLLLLLIITFGLASAIFAQTTNNYGTKVEWTDIDYAIPKLFSSELDKPILIDIYADWCGWCKKLDQEVYSNDEVAEFINKNFYAVKLDAEDKDRVIFTSETGDKITVRMFLDYFNVDSYPTTMIGTGDNAHLYKLTGYYDLENMSNVLVSSYYLYSVYYKTDD